jgi:hypothetical protein
MSEQNVDNLLKGYDAPAPEVKAPEPEAQQPEPEQQPETHPEPETKPEAPETDDSDADYGLDLDGESDSEKKYTESELNDRINKAVRERLERANRNKAPSEQISEQQAMQAHQDGFEFDNNSSESWEKQLENFVWNTVEKRFSEKQQEQQRNQEQARQQEYEQKFLDGMSKINSKYNDFEQVVGNQNITDPMVLGTRHMRDPAAFLYAASKNHSDELKRISSIDDPYQQIAAIGNLEAKMRSQSKKSKAPQPLSQTPESGASVGDRSIDAMINDYSRQKAKRRGIM